MACSLLIRCLASDEYQTPTPRYGVGVETSDGTVTPPFIFKHDLRLNTEAYIKYFEEVWIETVVSGRT